MSVIISDQTSTIEFLFSNGERQILDKDNLNIKESGTILRKYVYVTNGDGFINNPENEVIKLHYSDVTSPVVASNQELIEALLGYKASSGHTLGNIRITDGVRTVTLEPNGSLPVTLQDQTTPLVVTQFSILEQQTTTAAAMAIGDRQVTVTSPTGISVGKLITIFDPTAIRFSQCFCVGIAGSLVTLCSPIDFAYPSGSFVDVSDVNLNVDGSVTPVVAGIRNNAGAVPPPGLDLSVDITKVAISMVTATSPLLTDFGDIAGGLTNGVTLRRRDGDYYNIGNAKDNSELNLFMDDFAIYTALFGVDGLSCNIRFGGQSNFGSVPRLAINEDLEIIIQDNLTSITSLRIAAQGSIVQT